MSAPMAAEFTKDLLGLLAPVAQRILKGELVPLSDAPDGQAIVDQYIAGFPAMRSYVTAFLAASRAQSDYKWLQR